ncbi:MAG: hypothetical protein RPU61_04765 [Candidatus Sedimenticola sp. (ex Thyasira tokunagai)]
MEEDSKPQKSDLAEVAEGGINAAFHIMLWLAGLPWLIFGGLVIVTGDRHLQSIGSGLLLVIAGLLLLPPVIKSRYRGYAEKGLQPPSMGWFIAAYFGFAFAGVMLLF